jgi:hypothetical protein
MHLPSTLLYKIEYPIGNAGLDTTKIRLLQ